ncbi:MAG: alanine dehydrogenase, partial [Betaproteobacteria bacterium]
LALTQATLPHVARLAAMGWKQACAQDAGLQAGLQIARGQITYKPLAEDLERPWLDPMEAAR